jgi:ABC transporter substrate binding protein (PQQ-dependent alcohol dehydrogenase system)
MLQDARSAAPGATAALAWDASLTRFGADTLNERFRRRFGADMTSAAWSAWFAVKVLWESSLRMKSAARAPLADYLTRDTTRFDGHKGQPLSFRPWDHQLRQPLYARTATGFVEVPATRAPNESANDALDRLGKSTRASACHLRA